MQGSPSHPAAILLVEDEPAEVQLLQEVFTLLPVRTQLHVVSGGQEALAFLRHEAPYQHSPRPALILLSLKLPGMSGHELLGELKRDAVLQPFLPSSSPTRSRRRTSSRAINWVRIATTSSPSSSWT